MATSTLKLYAPTDSSTWKLLPEKCFCVEDIETYLSQFSASCTTISNFQYIKNQLNVEIKVDLSERYSAPLNANGTGYEYPAIKYVSITNSDEVRTYYYFVKKVEWRSTMTCRLQLVLDVLNTIKVNDDYTLDKKCHITRQHKNRFYKTRELVKFDLSIGTITGDAPLKWSRQELISVSSSALTTSVECAVRSIFKKTSNGYIFYLDPSDITERAMLLALTDGTEITITTDRGGGVYTGTIISHGEERNYIRNIDLLSEGINAPLYTNVNKKVVIGEDNRDWYLIYKNRQDPTEAQAQSLVNPVDCFLCTDESIKIAYSGGARRFLPAQMKAGVEYYISTDWWTGTLTLSDGTTILMDTSGSTQANGVSLQLSNNKIYISKLFVLDGLLWKDNLIETSYIDFSGSGVVQAREMNKIIQTQSGTSIFPMVSLVLGGSYVETNSIADIDRTDAKLIKIIKLPYCPVYFSKVSDVYQVDYNKFTYDSGINILKIKDLNMKFSNTLYLEYNPLNNLILQECPNESNNRDDKFESKIYHSDFFFSKFVYDSFGFTFQLEKVNTSRYDLYFTGTFDTKFTTTTTINSRFMFTFSKYITNSGTQDYDNVMPIARNNEIALYNVAYLNYIRSGFNYDVKAKQRTEAVSWVSTILSGIGTIASLVAPIGPLKIPTAIGLGSTFTMSLTNSINTTLTQENNMQQKLEQLKMQSASVYGSDDVDLMSEYTGNKAKLVEYNVSNQMKTLLLDLFYYIGYNENITTTPNITSRYWFNHLACDPVFNWTKPNIPEELKEELTSLYKSGITFMHKQFVSSVATWDLDQVKENAEVSIEEI